MANLDAIKTIVVVMMENRSFDHMLGYLSLPPFNRTDVDGLKADPAWQAQFTNYDGARAIKPFLNSNPFDMPDDFDPPHERLNMAANLGALQNNVYPMNGFVSAIPPSVSTKPDVRKLVMSYFGAEQVPISHFFSQKFAICDRWFSAIPAGTQPNRLMSMSGETLIDVNHDILPPQDLVYDWLTRHGVSWRVYHQGIPFFTMMLKWLPEILLNKNFRSFNDLAGDLMNSAPDDLPQVIFVEPTYQDAPHLGFATDEHAPSGVSNGQEFLMQVYNALVNSPFWRNSLMIVDYDENGAFFDHVSPPIIATAPQAGATWSNPSPFVSLGPRIIAIAVTLLAGTAQAQPAPTITTTIQDASPIQVIPTSPFDDGSAIKAQEEMFRQEGAMLDGGVKVAGQAKTSLNDFQTRFNKAVASNSYKDAAQILAVSERTLAQAQAIDAKVFRFCVHNDSPAGRAYTAADASLAAAQQTLAQMENAFLPLAKSELASAIAEQSVRNDQLGVAAAARRAAAEKWDNKITGSLGDLSASFAGGPPASEANCNVFVGQTLEKVYGFSDFKAADGHYLLANQIADYLVTSPNWTLIGVADNQSVLVQAADSADSRPVIAVWRNPDLTKHGHVVLIGPGPLQLSGWGLLVPNSAGFSMDNPTAGYIGGGLSKAFGKDKKSSVLIYVRSKP